MTNRWFWVNDRLSWPLVTALVLVTTFTILFDLGWRTLTLPFETYLFLAALVAAAIVLVFTVVCVFSRRRAAGKFVDNVAVGAIARRGN